MPTRTDRAVQIGVQVFVWGILIRTVYVWHITWLVNSASHRWGYRNYETSDRSRNNWFVALLTNGEGWHNNHHATPRACSQGHRWWEVDLTFTFVRMLQVVGLAWDVVAGASAQTHSGIRATRGPNPPFSRRPEGVRELSWAHREVLHATDRPLERRASAGTAI